MADDADAGEADAGRVGLGGFKGSARHQGSISTIWLDSFVPNYDPNKNMARVCNKALEPSKHTLLTCILYHGPIISCRSAASSARAPAPEQTPWLRTSGVSTNGAAATAVIFDRLGKKVRPGTFGNVKVG